MPATQCSLRCLVKRNNLETPGETKAGTVTPHLYNPTHLASFLTSARAEWDRARGFTLCKIRTLLRITAQPPAHFIAACPDKWKILSLSEALSVYLKPISLGPFFFGYTHNLCHLCRALKFHSRQHSTKPLLISSLCSF